ncbi:hypothetical protein KTT_21350 [Tengunoibacter tsumagoiensis]|uniref:Uncharacterized protein n=1 Tax=Tengunoibacter tsumagoiensis TaxID=2014871 RepID=A0A401ZZK8_9CHLR|nr:hypothetical protein KTT_21350 [Tengunoibacter tsumagoiensis]
MFAAHAGHHLQVLVEWTPEFQATAEDEETIQIGRDNPEHSMILVLRNISKIQIFILHEYEIHAFNKQGEILAVYTVTQGHHYACFEPWMDTHQRSWPLLANSPMRDRVSSRSMNLNFKKVTQKKRKKM